MDGRKKQRSRRIVVVLMVVCHIIIFTSFLVGFLDIALAILLFLGVLLGTFYYIWKKT